MSQIGCRSALSGVRWLTIRVSEKKCPGFWLADATVMAGDAKGLHMSSCSFFTLPLLPPTLLPCVMSSVLPTHCTDSSFRNFAGIRHSMPLSTSLLRKHQRDPDLLVELS